MSFSLEIYMWFLTRKSTSTLYFWTNTRFSSLFSADWHDDSKSIWALLADFPLDCLLGNWHFAYSHFDKRKILHSISVHVWKLLVLEIFKCNFDKILAILLKIWLRNLSIQVKSAKFVFWSSYPLIARTYLQTPLRLPEFFPIGQWNRFE